MPTIHLVIPFLDEMSTLTTLVERVLAVDWPRGWAASIILVDDGSGLEARDEARRIAKTNGFVQLLCHDRNLGKGAALRTGFSVAIEQAENADVIGIQDADLEYEPKDLSRFVEVFEDLGSDVDAVFGNRWTEAPNTAIGWIHRFGNRMLTELSNATTGLGLNDMECCFKVFRRDILREMIPELSESRFAIEPQLAAALARRGANVAEVDVDYEPRSFADGKKIGLRDLASAVTTIIREWFHTRRYRRDLE